MTRTRHTYVYNNSSFVLQSLDGFRFRRGVTSRPDQNIGGDAGVEARFGNKPAHAPGSDDQGPRS